jgi:hypothetical protein
VYIGSGDTDPLNLKLGTGRRRLTSSPGQFTRGNVRPYPLNTRFVIPKSRFVVLEKRKILFASTGIRTQVRLS